MAAVGGGPPGVAPEAPPGVPDVTAPKVVHRVKSKMGYTEMHTTAPGFGENVCSTALSFCKSKSARKD